MNPVLFINGQEYYFLNELLDSMDDNKNIFLRNDIQKMIFNFHGKNYITKDTWKYIEELVKTEKDSYTEAFIKNYFDYTPDDYYEAIITPLRIIVPPVTIGETNYYKKSEINKIKNISQIYSQAYGEDLIFGYDLVRYHNSNVDNGRLYFMDNLYISEFHLRFLYPRRSLKTINGRLCITAPAEQMYKDFDSRCRKYTELDFFDNYFDGCINYPDTLALLKKFYTLTLNRSTTQKRWQKSQQLLEDSYDFYDLLDKEIYGYSSPELITLLDTYQTNHGNSKHILNFLNYVKQEYATFATDIKAFGFSGNEGDSFSENMLLEPAKFAEIYYQALNIDRHIKNAYNDPMYAQYWLYVLIMLTNFIRVSDVTDIPIMTLPRQYEEDYFIDHKIKPEEAEEICHIFEITARSQMIRKTDTHKHVYVTEDQKPALAIALIICNQNAERAHLRRLFSAKTIPADRIANKLGTPFFDISNRKMNYSLATFFEESGSEGKNYRENVYSLLTDMRSHKRATPLTQSNTTAIYIKAQSTDLNASTMALHAFRRGVFGWVYHLLLEAANREFDTLEDETKAIEELTEKYSPYNVEAISDFVKHEKEEKQEVVKQVMQIPKSVIKRFLENLGLAGTFKYSPDLPCIFAMNCPFAERECLNCQYSVKTIHSVYTYVIETSKVLKDLQTTKNENEVGRDINLLYKYLRIFQELRVDYGKEYVSAFIDSDQLKEQVRNLPVSELKLLSEVKNDKRNPEKNEH